MFMPGTIFVCILWCLIAPSSSDRQIPDIKVRVSKDGLNHITQTLVNNLIKNISNVNFSEVHDVKNTVFGKMNFSITEMKIFKASKSLFNINFDEAVNGFIVHISDGAISGRTKWMYHLLKLKIRDNGYIKFDIRHLDLNLILKMMSIETDHMALVINNCDAKIKDINLLFEGKRSWLYNRFRWLITRYFKKPCKLITNIFEKYVKNMSAMLIKFINGLTDFDFSLTEAPVIKKDFIELNFKWELLEDDDFEEISNWAVNVTTENTGDRMITLWFTENSANRFFRSSFEKGIFQKKFIIEDFSDDSNQSSRFSYFGYSFMTIYRATSLSNLESTESTLEIKFIATKTPIFSVETKGVYVTINDILSTFYAKTEDKTERNLFTFTLNVRVEITITNGTVLWKIDGDKFEMELLSNDLYLPNFMIKTFVGNWLISKINLLGKTGLRFPLPDNLNFYNFSMAVDSGNVRLQSDFSWAEL